jgi:hypothetical protein
MERLSSSFRDDAGYLFTHQGILYRAITPAGRADYELLMKSGLYHSLATENKLIAHQEVTLPDQKDAVKVLQPNRIPFISYPYEWSFSQLQDAALLTLDIQTQALKKGLSLKDASFFNIQFQGSSPVFIDTLSFEERKDTPWVAYRQFCQHFLGPLVLMAHKNPTMNRDLVAYIDGFSLDMLSRLLPLKDKVKPSLFLHLVMHASSQRKYDKTQKVQVKANSGLATFGLIKQLSLVDSLYSLIEGLCLAKEKTQWGDYATQTDHYSSEAEVFKKGFVEHFLDRLAPKSVWDFGGNIGNYSRLASARRIYSVCLDGDYLAVEKNYLTSKQEKNEYILPLLMDLSNPTPAVGWANQERHSLLQRGPADLVLCLALVHHLRITANIPFESILSFMASSGRNIVIEFVPKEDGMAQKLLCSREDIFHDYTRDCFENLFRKYFAIIATQPIPGASRVLYYGERL